MLRRVSPRSFLVVCAIAGQIIFLVHFLRTTDERVSQTKRFQEVSEIALIRQGRENDPAVIVNSWPRKDNITGVMHRVKYFIAFSYWEQFSMATSNLFSLTALAAKTGRQAVVIPFVNGSFFNGNENTGTLERYYDINQFNEFLHSQGLVPLVRLETFRDACQNRLDILLIFLFRNTKRESPGFYSCDDQEDVFEGFKVGKTICIESKLNSIELFHDEVIQEFPCVGIKMWRGHGAPCRSTFPLPGSLGKKEVHHFFRKSLLQMAQDFITKNLGADFISVHLRLEKIKDNTKNLSFVEECLSRLIKEVQEAKERSSQLRPRKVFLAGDFSEFGSQSRRMKASRKLGVETVADNYFNKLDAVTFNPSDYNLSDRGSVAIVEMVILSNGRELFLVGGGTFQNWVKFQFMEKNSGDESKIYRIDKRLPQGKH